MNKTSLKLIAVAGALAFGAANLTAPVLAHAAADSSCADEAMMTKEMAMKVTDAAIKEKALKHVAMADEKAKAGMESDCMAEVMKAKAVMDGKKMMDDKMDDKMDNKTSG